MLQTKWPMQIVAIEMHYSLKPN